MRLPLAPLKSRFAALFIDLCFIIFYAFCLFGASLIFYQLVFGGIPDVVDAIGIHGAHLLGFVTLTLPVGLYFFMTESGHHQATLGKRLVKLKVTSKTQTNLSKKQIILRTIVKLLPWETAHTFIYPVVYYSNSDLQTPIWVMAGLCVANILPFIYLGVVLFRKDRAAPHDLAAKTLVTIAAKHES